jgi:hypothetical protein
MGSQRQKDAFMKIGYVRVSKQEQHEALQVTFTIGKELR